MPHLDPDRLIELAFAEELEELTESGHLARCEHCRHEIAVLRHVAGVGAEGQELRDLPAPPEHVWQAIEAEVAGPPARRRKWLVAAVAAVVLAVVGVIVVVRAPAEQITARATLTPLGTVPPTAGGDVRVLADGRLRIDVHNLPLTTGFHEVWLLDPEDPAKMVALGSLADRPTLLPVPPGTDLARYRLVDVSDEPHDGNAAHSGHSLLRGTLTS
ncbi:anti-sigma factor [Actinoplanes bogorensis]|uniref:Anti-sigma factor n=1 Tax=Paractinoplanes bogorensis TaxID=1610840 RepID=A0ABS5YWY0_9ACTN|nr:anti-sigma factor [Actinoplanes bogorensis]MBU2667946.1 anti-sigma factor [Actinoplanes bogorensis]